MAELYKFASRLSSVYHQTNTVRSDASLTITSCLLLIIISAFNIYPTDSVNLSDKMHNVGAQPHSGQSLHGDMQVTVFLKNWQITTSS